MRCRIVVVIPCYNEAARLRAEDVMPMLADPDVGLLFVDDGSTDNTAALLAEIAARDPARIDVLTLRRNQGKAEAVRQGLCHGLGVGADVVGYIDADMATPAGEVLRLITTLDESGANAVIGARVAVLGTDIQRKHTRHYLGRVFATFASIILRAPVYDTQCGAKVFRKTAALDAALAAPFHSRWAFDVELLGRLMVEAGGYRHAGIIEMPLRRWIDAAGSKVKPTHMIRAGLDLAIIARELDRRRRAR